MTCTWKDCKNKGKHSLLDRDGKQWAFLCEEHNKEVDDSIIEQPFVPGRALRAWVLAHGGAKEMLK